MPFVISRGFAEFQIQKMALSLEPLEYVDKLLHTHYYWQDLDTGISKCHLSSVEAMPRSKFWIVEAMPKSKF